MDSKRQPLCDLRFKLNSRANKFSTNKSKNYELNKELVTTVQNNIKTNKRPTDVSGELKTSKKLNNSSSRHNQIFYTKVTGYIENSQKVTSTRQFLYGPILLKHADKNLQVNANDSKKTVCVDRSDINIISTKSSSKYKMSSNTTDKIRIINSDIILRPNTKMTKNMQRRINDALEAIYVITTNNILTQENVSNYEIKLFGSTIKNVINDRLISMLTGRLVLSRSDIIDKYLYRHPQETDMELLKLYITPSPSYNILNLIETDNPNHYLKLNMMRVVTIKMNKIIGVVQNMFKNSKRQMLDIRKRIRTKTNNSNNMIQGRAFCNQYTSLLVQKELARILATQRNDIIHSIVQREYTQAIRLKIIQI